MHTATNQGGGSNAPMTNQHEYGMFVGEDVLDDDRGLIVEWPDLPTRRPMDFLKDLPDEYATILSRFANPIDAHDDVLHIYTDGSASKYDGDTRSAWAFVVFKCKIGQEGSDCLQYVDWFGNITQDDPMHSQWTGAMEQSSRSGEGEAIAWAFLWALQRHPPCKIIIHSDATSVLFAAEGQWNFPHDDHLLLRVRALYKLLWTLMTDGYLQIQHIQAHAGHPGNEIADLLAKAVCGMHEPGRLPNVSACCKMDAWKSSPH